MVAFSATSVSLILVFSLYGPSELSIAALYHFPFSVPVLTPFSDTALILEGLPWASPVPPSRTLGTLPSGIQVTTLLAPT